MSRPHHAGAPEQGRSITCANAAAGPFRLAGLVLVVAAAGCGNDPTAPQSNVMTADANAECLARATFGEPADSPYVLPYPVGSGFRVTQSYCNPNGGHRGTFAYDFAMEMGAPITAIRSGVVTGANDQYADDDNVSGHENNVFVLHDDGTFVRYTHLQQGSVVAAAGERVRRGDLLGLNGASGNSGGLPHLHLEIFASQQIAKPNSIPINFRNAEGALDGRGGLASGTTYVALPY